MSSFASSWDKFVGVLNMATAGWMPGRSMKTEFVDMKGKTCLVTGSNVGIGYEIASKLAKSGATVYLLVRDPVKGEVARTTLIDATGNEDIHVRAIDMGSLASVREFASTWDSSVPIHVLINNAGMVTSKYLKTRDGHEITLQVNALAPHILSLGLLPVLADNARIINVTSHAHYESTLADLPADDPNHHTMLGGLYKDGEGIPLSRTMWLYSRSKAVQMMLGRELQHRLSASSVYGPKKIVVHSCQPGFVASTIWEERPDTQDHGTERVRATLKKIVGILASTSEQGAVTPYFLASSAPAKEVYDFGYWDRKVKRVPGQPVLNESLVSAYWDACTPDKDSETLA
ncbi:hypothetical protein DFH07DRAFT_856198 [Mycena maculata]|uniref:NAD(P)-binding protein n=1 Tax=Mycena maculata TaxID=230809 RepID=A0AAD7HL26_9AGAR|nr:hypothetical protein DFH07DRAFT_856198 [Mycena maculata]